MKQAHPLSWPPGWPRTPAHKRRSAQFQVSRSQAIADLLDELRKLRAKNVILSSDVETYERGGRQIPYANQSVDDPGVAVYFTLEGEEQCIPCDKWRSMKDNVRAVGLTVQALRGVERWGAKEMMQAAFRGFQALPAPGQINLGHKKPWYEVLGVSPDAPLSVRKGAYRALAKERHPDAGGSPASWEELRKAAEEAGL